MNLRLRQRAGTNGRVGILNFDIDQVLLAQRFKNVLCSDGLSNHVSAEEMKQMLQSEATSAEMAARRLVNLANIHGAADNVTVVVIRVS